jgi:hypothetical protein
MVYRLAYRMLGSGPAARELETMLDAAIETLPARDRALLVMHYTPSANSRA